MSEWRWFWKKHSPVSISANNERWIRCHFNLAFWQKVHVYVNWSTRKWTQQEEHCYVPYYRPQKQQLCEACKRREPWAGLSCLCIPRTTAEKALHCRRHYFRSGSLYFSRILNGTVLWNSWEAKSHNLILGSLTGSLLHYYALELDSHLLVVCTVVLLLKIRFDRMVSNLK